MVMQIQDGLGCFQLVGSDECEDRWQSAWVWLVWDAVSWDSGMTGFFSHLSPCIRRLVSAFSLRVKATKLFEAQP